MNNAPINDKLKPYLSPVGAWAFAIGTSVGWGSLVITSNTYLSKEQTHLCMRIREC